MEDKFRDKEKEKFEKRMVIGALVFIGAIIVLLIVFNFVFGLT